MSFFGTFYARIQCGENERIKMIVRMLIYFIKAYLEAKLIFHPRWQ